MRDFLEVIRTMPTVHNNVHESIYRSHGILELVKDWCEKGIDPKIICMWIEHLESNGTNAAYTETK